jgi:hypothetical protein
MSLLKKYSCLYGDLDFTPEEEADLGAFAARLIKVAVDGNPEALEEFFRREFEGEMDKVACERVLDYGNWIVEFDKTAAPLGAVMSTLGKALAPLSLALAAAPLVGHGVKALGRKGGLEKSLEQIYKQKPHLRQDPHTKDYFESIASFAPEVARSPLLAGNVIDQMHRVGPSYVTPQLIRELVGLQTQTQMQGPMATPTGAAAGMAKPTMDLAQFLSQQYGKGGR